MTAGCASVARHGEEGGRDDWAQERSRAPHHSPTRTADELRDQIAAARQRLVANPRAQYGSLAVQWELRRLGVEPIPPSRTIERVLARAGLSQPRRRSPRHASKGVPYPTPVGVEPGTTHQVDLVGPRHLFGGVEFHALNVIDVGSPRGGQRHPRGRAAAVAGPIAGRHLVGRGSPSGGPVRQPRQLPGGIQPAFEHFGTVVTTCLDLGVTPRFIPLREPWRNGVVEHVNDVWDKSFFRTEVSGGLDHLRAENRAFIAFHNTHHRYAAHGGSSPSDVMAGRLRNPLSASYRPPTRLPAKGRIEVVRYVRSNCRVELFGKRITVAEDQTHQYVTAVIKVRTRMVIIVTIRRDHPSGRLRPVHACSAEDAPPERCPGGASLPGLGTMSCRYSCSR